MKVLMNIVEIGPLSKICSAGFWIIAISSQARNVGRFEQY